MPLLDHFRGVQRERRNPSAFLSAWATFLASQINSMLPIGYFAESNVQFGIEIDVATMEERESDTKLCRPCRSASAAAAFCHWT
jgi:hypothetical protein